MAVARRALAVVIIAVLAVVAGVAINQTLDPQQNVALPWLAVALLASALTAVFGEQVKALSRGLGIFACKRLRLLAGKASLAELGVHDSHLNNENDYILRDVDTELRQSLTDLSAHSVLLTGTRLAGTSRTLAEAVIATMDNASIHVIGEYEFPSEEELHGWIQGSKVLYFEKIKSRQLEKMAVLHATRKLQGVRLVGTIDLKVLRSSTTLSSAARSFLENAKVHDLGPISRTERERVISRPKLAELLDQFHGASVFLGRLFVHMEHVVRLLTISDEDSMERVACLRAITDWGRLEVPELLTERRLLSLFRAYLKDMTGIHLSKDAAERMLHKVLKGLARHKFTASATLIVSMRSRQGVVYNPSSLLIEVADQDSASMRASWEVPSVFWEFVTEVLWGNARQAVGLQAYRRGNLLESSDLLSAVPEDVDAAIAEALGRAEHDAGRTDRGRFWMEKVFISGNRVQRGEAAIAIAVDSSDKDVKREWLRRAIIVGYDPMVAVALLFIGLIEISCSTTKARYYLHRAFIRDNKSAAAQAALGLGIIEHKSGNCKLALEYWQFAMESRDSVAKLQALIFAATFHYQNVEPAVAMSLLRKVMEEDDGEYGRKAAKSLADLEWESGNPHEALETIRNVYLNFNDSIAMAARITAAEIEKELGRTREAFQLLHEALASGHSEHMLRVKMHLGLLHADVGHYADARALYLEVIAEGDEWYVATNTVNLALVEGKLGDEEEECRLLERALKSNVEYAWATACFNLGGLELKRGNVEAAKRLFRRTANSSSQTVKMMAQKSLESLKARQNADKLADWFLKYGDSSSID